MNIDDIIARMGWERTARPTVALLGGGITNLNYRVDVGGEAYVVRVPGQDSASLGIDRECEHACAVAAHASGVAPEVVAYLEEEGVLITRFIHGRGLGEAEMRQAGTVGRVAQALRRYHGGGPFPGTFSPFGKVRKYLAAAEPHGAPLPERFAWMMEQAAKLEASLGAPSTLRPCHNDLLPGNFLDDGERLWIVDWEYAATGDIFFDLGNFAVHHQLSDSLEHALLEVYFGHVTAGTMARLKLMKIISDLREAMWAMVQVAISDLDYDFRTYGRMHFDRYAAALGDPRLPAWLAQVADPFSRGV
ncbi:MAG TPA: phosphotransferase [bacterium]|nr:phosphotransferase [bacterium]